jgi:hypothetical protein
MNDNEGQIEQSSRLLAPELIPVASSPSSQFYLCVASLCTLANIEGGMHEVVIGLHCVSDFHCGNYVQRLRELRLSRATCGVVQANLGINGRG